MTRQETPADSPPAFRVADLSDGGSDWQGWFARAMPPDMSWQDSGTGTPADLDALLAAGGRVLVIYAAPGAVLEQALRQGRPPGPALDDWLARARAILRAYRRHRRSAFLVDAAAFAGAPRPLAERLAAWSGVALRARAPRRATAGAAAPHAAVAAALALCVPGVRELADELETGGFALPPGAEPDPAALDRFFESLVPQARLGELEAALAAAVRERDAVAQARDAVEARAAETAGRLETLAAEAEARAAADEQIALLTDQLAAVQEMLEQEHRARLSLEEEALPAVQSRLDAATGERDAARAEAAQTLERLTGECRALQRELEESRAEIARLLKSRSMRLTAPLRAVRRLGGLGRDDG